VSRCRELRERAVEALCCAQDERQQSTSPTIQKHPFAAEHLCGELDVVDS
jgi:hypothetical protein